jgi:L-asparagine oxygenase
MQSGFAFFASYLPTESSSKAMAKLGRVQKLPGVNVIQELTPKDSADSPPNIYSGNFGYDDFPFHTDLAHWFLPPRYLALRCIEGAPDVKTRLIDSREIIKALGKDVLCRALFMPRRPIDMKRSLLRLLEQCKHGEWRFRWDSLFIVPATKHSAITRDAILQNLSAAAPHEFVLEKPGDTLIVDNWRMLHARSAVPLNQLSRKIHRVYLSSILWNVK